MLASFASARSTKQCALSFAQTYFKEDLKRVNVPTLITHGDADKTVPIEASSNRTAKMIANSQYIVYERAPHGLVYTHRDQLNQDIVAFITSSQDVYSGSRKKTIYPNFLQLIYHKVWNRFQSLFIRPIYTSGFSL